MEDEYREAKKVLFTKTKNPVLSQINSRNQVISLKRTEMEPHWHGDKEKFNSYGKVR